MANERPPQNQESTPEAPAAPTTLPSPESLQPVGTPPPTAEQTQRIQELLPQQEAAAEQTISSEQPEGAQDAVGASGNQAAVAHKTTENSAAGKHENHAGGHGHHGFSATVGASGWFFMFFGLISSTLANLAGKVFKAVGLKTEGGGGGGGGGHDDHH